MKALGISILIVLILAVVIVAAGAGAMYKAPELRIHARARLLAGFGAVNCGVVKPGSDSGASNACVLNAVTDQKPFFVVYDTQEKRPDFFVIDAMAADKAGQLYDIEFISRRWDTQDLPAAAKMSDDRYIFTDLCPAPSNINKSIYKGLTCSPRIMLH